MSFVGLVIFSLASGQLPELPDLAIEKLSAESREVVQELYRKVQENPRDPLFNGRLGMFMHAHEQHELAETWYERAHLLDPKAFEWLYYLGTVEGLLGKREASVNHLKKALQLKPDYLAGRIKLAEALFNAGRISESIEAFDAVLKEDFRQPLAHYGVGRAWVARGERQSGIEHLLKACELSPGFGSAHYALGLAYRDSVEDQKAREHFSLYTKNKNSWPDDGDVLLDQVKELKTGARAHLNLGVKLANENHTEEAIREHEKALELEPQMVQAHIHLIRLYAQAGRPDKAELHYRKAVEVNSNLAESHYNFGVFLSEQGRYKEAAEAFRKSLTINPHYAHAHNNIGSMLQREGKLEEAAEHFREAIHNDPSYRLARFNLGRILVAQGKNPEAIEQFSMILQPEDEETPRYMYALAAAHVRAGENDKALPYAERAKKLATDLGQTDLAQLIERDLQMLKKVVKPQ